jgi:hypothetical protein
MQKHRKNGNTDSAPPRSPRPTSRTLLRERESISLAERKTKKAENAGANAREKTDVNHNAGEFEKTGEKTDIKLNVDESALDLGASSLGESDRLEHRLDAEILDVDLDKEVRLEHRLDAEILNVDLDKEVLGSYTANSRYWIRRYEDLE